MEEWPGLLRKTSVQPQQVYRVPYSALPQTACGHLSIDAVDHLDKAIQKTFKVTWVWEVTDKQGLKAMSRPYISGKANESWVLNIEFGPDPVHTEILGSGTAVPLSHYTSGKNNPIWSLAFKIEIIAGKNIKCTPIKWLLYSQVKTTNPNNTSSWKVATTGA